MLLVRIDRYLRRSGMAPTRFGKVTLGDPGLLAEMRRGRQLRAGTVARLDRFLAERGA